VDVEAIEQHFPAAEMERMMKIQEAISEAMAGRLTWMRAAEIIGITDRLNECVDESLRRHFTNYDCKTCALPGPLALLNGKLLAAAENAGFDALITVDQNLPKQQNVAYPRTVDRCTERAHNEHKRAHNEHR
jgi:hypothetical protein